MSVGACIAGIEKLHGLEIDLSAFQYKSYPVVQPEVRSGGGCKRFVHEREDRVVCFTEDLGMVGIGGNALQSEEENVLKRLYVRLIRTSDTRSTTAGPVSPGPRQRSAA